MQLLTFFAAAALAGILLWAGLEKARNLSAFAAVLTQLGVVQQHARAAARAVITLELGVALALCFRADSPVTLLIVLLLASAFAGAGLAALRRNEAIRCNCFGPYGNHLLGRPQLIAWPLWLAALTLLWLNPLPATNGAALLMTVALTMAALRVVPALRAALGARADRRSAREMFLWLNR